MNPQEPQVTPSQPSIPEPTVVSSVTIDGAVQPPEPSQTQQFSQSLGSQKKPDKLSPPVAAQVLYAFGFIGLILGLYSSFLIYSAGSFESVSTKLYGVNFQNLQILAIFTAVVTIANFTLINFIRAGKRWALVAFTILYVFGLITSLLDKSLVGLALIMQLLWLVLLITLWSKNRDYFNK